MKTILTSVFSFVLTFALYAQGEVINTTFTSTSFDGDAFDVSVYLPEGYDADSDPYPWVIFLHGCCGDNKDYGLGQMRPVLDTKIENGEIAPIVAVFPDAQSTLFQSGHEWENSTAHGFYADLVNVDLVSWVESNYNVSTDRCGRAIGGFSSGGSGAMRIAARNADRYAAAFSHSGSIALEAFLNYIPFVLEESPEDTAPYTYPYMVDYGYTWELYVVGSAFSPNADAEYGVDFPLTPEGTVDSAVFYGEWIANHDPVQLLDDAQSQPDYPGLGLYFDSGALGIDMVYVKQFNDLFTAQLQERELLHRYIVFESEGHQVSAERVDSLLSWLNVQWGECNTVTSLANPSPAPVTLNSSPNPATNWVEVSFTSPEAAPSARLVLLNAFGRTVRNIEIGKIAAGATYQHRLNLRQLPGGMYFIRLEGLQDGGTSTTTLIVD